MIDTLRLTAEGAIALLERREVSAAELHAAYLDAIAERDGELHCYLRTSAEASGEGIPIALKDVISTKGIETTAGSKILSGYTPVFDATVAARVKASRAVAARQDEHRRVRDGLVDGELGVGGRRGIRGIRRGYPAARAGAPRRPSRWASRRGDSARTRAARSSSPRRCAGTSVYGRPTGRSRATASSRSHRASTRSGRSRRLCATSRFCTRSSRAAIRSTRRPRSYPEAVRLPEGDSLAGVRLAVPKQVADLDAIEPGVRAAFQQSLTARVSSARRWGSATFRSRIATGCRATTSSRPPRRRRTWPATTASATGFARTRPRTTTWWSGLATTGSAPSRSAGSCSARTRFPPGYYDAYYGQAQRVRNAAHPRAPRGAGGLRRDRHADVTDGRLPGGRQGRGSARHVRVRSPHDPVVSRRPARALDPVRPVRGAARRASAHRAAVRRERLFRIGHALEQAIGFDTVPERLR